MCFSLSGQLNCPDFSKKKRDLALFHNKKMSALTLLRYTGYKTTPNHRLFKQNTRNSDQKGTP